MINRLIIIIITTTISSSLFIQFGRFSEAKLNSSENVHLLAKIGPMCTVNMMERHIKGGQKTIVFFGSFFRPTSDVNILKTVYPIYLKINVQRVASGDSFHFKYTKRDRFWPTIYVPFMFTVGHLIWQ